MEYEWDPNKNEINLAKHKISFAAATRVFGDPDHIIVDSTRAKHGEQRMKAIGMVGPELTVVIFTNRGSNRRIISTRRSRTNERRDYDQSKERT
jgi:uncharacterized DUF497 family protein